MSEREGTNCNIYLPKELLAQTDRVAEATGRSRSGLIQQALSIYCSAYEVSQKLAEEMSGPPDDDSD